LNTFLKYAIKPWLSDVLIVTWHK